MTNAIAELKPAESAPVADSTMSDIMLNTELLKGIQDLAKHMSQATVTVPKHLAGSPADCYAVILQAVQWKMNPFAVAQKTHVINGTLGYEAQLVNAVIQASGAVGSRFHYEYEGEGAKLRCRVGAIIRGESGITWNEWLCFADVTTKNSPLWKTNPKQQLGYLQVKNWARLYCPGAILGVYTPDELAEKVPGEREVGPKTSDLNETLRGKPKAEEVAEEVVDAEVVQESEQEQEEREPLTYAAVMERFNQAQDLDELSAAGACAADFMSAGGNEKFRDELSAAYKASVKALQAARAAEEFGE